MTPAATPDIISLGESMVEFFSEEPIARAGSFEKACGGDTLNTLVAAARLGARTGFVTRVGDDPFAPFLLEAWRAEGIDVSHADLVEGFNGIYFISLLPGGEREFTYYRRGSAASTMTPADLDPTYIGGARVLHVSGISQAISASCRETVLAAVRLARERGVLVSYDPNLRRKLWPSLAEARAAMQEVLPFADVVLPSAPEEMTELLDARTIEEGVERLWAAGVGTVAAKLGEKGCLLGYEGRVIAIPPYVADSVVDATGAGDAFDGAFLHGLVSGLSPEEAARLAVVCAGLSLRKRGAIGGLPFREEAYAAWQALPRG
jgi:2-dehydro-3-deoxygluconokinase